MDVSNATTVYRAPSISNQRLDFSSKNFSSEERSTVNQIAILQDESFAHTATRYQLTKHVGIEKGIAFKDGITVVENIGDFVKALRNKAEQMGGTDRFGVKAEQYHNMGVAKGYFVDERI
ncbi:hypothetical protein [Salinibius halmophilus]|uniref:hypothetical protein n=1 Tax=Salinibius halmophilus TaxID=1853216 RepID=UPI001314E036|nr:hypothetical protein [Salinibius halmophilus]